MQNALREMGVARINYMQNARREMVQSRARIMVLAQGWLALNDEQELDAIEQKKLRTMFQHHH
jgi:hypothetical protein